MIDKSIVIEPIFIKLGWTFNVLTFAKKINCSENYEISFKANI